MKKIEPIELLRRRSEKIYADGTLLNYTLYGDQHCKRYYLPKQEYDVNIYNDVQNFLYKQAMFGLNAYTQKEIAEMPKKKYHKIIRLYTRTKKEVNIIKQSLVIKHSNQIFNLFPNSSLLRTIMQDDFVDPTVNNKLSLTDLGIKKEFVINRLYTVGILPNNFHQINTK